MRTLNNFETNQKTQIKICTEVDRSVDPISVDSVYIILPLPSFLFNPEVAP